MDGINDEQLEAKTREEYEAVCSKLNMDEYSREAAWTSYTRTRDYYTLEVGKTALNQQ